MKVLILTDHSKHSNENSLYTLAVKLLAHPSIGQIDIATRTNDSNNAFFGSQSEAALLVTTIDKQFHFTDPSLLLKNLFPADLENYDFIWLRLPPPLSEEFLQYLTIRFNNKIIINDPKGIHLTGSKAFLLNFPSVCPPMKICNSWETIEEFKQNFPIVLKPFREYGGKGIVKIDGEQVFIGKEVLSYKDFKLRQNSEKLNYLGVKFLKNVSHGDKRIIVVNGKILGASLRLPAKDSWLCNVSMGGTSHMTDIDPEEYQMVETINPILNKMGIVMYGIDTLVEDNGKRILSEINTTSIGGLPQIAKLKNLPLVEQAIDLIINYITNKTLHYAGCPSDQSP